MKTLSILSLAVLMVAVAQAAPAVQPKDLSEDALRGVATERQKASLDAYKEALAKADKQRADAMKDAREVTKRNNSGMLKTIQKRQLNTMLPPCEREPEAPREDSRFRVRY